MMSMKFHSFCLAAVCILTSFTSVKAVNVTVSPDTVSVQIGDIANVSIKFSEPLPENATLLITYQFGNDDESYTQEKDVIQPLDNITLPAQSLGASFIITGNLPGSVIVGLNSSSAEFENLESSFVRVSVVRSNALDIFIIIIGWIYFVAWSVSFYPQVILNFRRKSVVGLNFDFLAYNITGFVAYGLFNVGMYWIPEIMAQYKEMYPRGVNPVLLNDVIFTLHAVLITAFTIFQCFIYERQDQRISRIALIILALIGVFALITLFLAVGKVITWLMYLQYYSYIKLGITLIKYIPQALMNYRRKSTDGWSIGNILLDFTGGSLSILQMFLLSYNNDDWSSIFGDPTKFGLGFFSILFDILFIVQHYCLYRTRREYVALDTGDMEG